LLKQLRNESWNKYEIRDWSIIGGCKDYPWHICDGPRTALAYHQYATKEEAINAIKLLWHDLAQKYLWENRTKRKRNKYPW
jgi:hypothetical protein